LPEPETKSRRNHIQEKEESKINDVEEEEERRVTTR
jgi:hypothetical protein